MLSYVIPTRDRLEDLSLTLRAIASLDHALAREVFGGVEVIVVDNASRVLPIVPPVLAGGIAVRPLFRASNEGAAARNVAALSASGPSRNPDHWLVMLDDDSAPLDTGFIEALASAPADVAAVGAEVLLKPGHHHGREAGGLPEVFIGCGVAIRRSVFVELGGYDATFGYYAEEYDLAARMMLAGWRMTWDRRFRVHHRKVSHNRDTSTILRHLVRNNVCVMQRYAPESLVTAEIDATIERYLAIAHREHATAGVDEGLMDLQAIITAQPRREMPMDLWERFTGLAASRAWLTRQARRGLRRVMINESPTAKGGPVIRRAAEEAGLEIVPAGGKGAEAVLVGTLSPGPMLDTAEALVKDQHLPVIVPWCMGAEAPAALLSEAA